MRLFQFIAALWLTLSCIFAPAHAEKRVALVIGNNSYANLRADEQLLKAVNDARAVGGALKSIGFEVMSGENLGRSALVDKLDAFTQRLDAGDTAFFFFSGHGVSLGGGNYILPSDIPNIGENQESRLMLDALSEQDIVVGLRNRGVRVAVVVLDACRNNPFARSGGKGVGFARGLQAPPQVSGVFSLYAAAAGQSALDRLSEDDRNPNSVFSRALVPRLTRPGLDLRDLAYEVREEVAQIAAAAGYDQRPASYDETVGGRIYLAGLPPAGGETAATPPPGGQTAVPPPQFAAERAWSVIQNSTSLAVLDDYIRQFGTDPVYGSMAKARREEVAKSQVAVVVPVTPPSVVSPPPQRDAPLTPDRERGLKRGDTFRECTDCPEMVVVPAGSFTMGSPASEKERNSDEGPQHVVTTGRPFAAGKLHVTVDQFAAFVKKTGYAASSSCYKWASDGGSHGSWRDPGFGQEGSHPVVCVSWDDAKAYADWLAKETGRPYRLLSEAEFEYAARSRTAPGAYPRFWFGNDDGDLCRNGNGPDQKARDMIAAIKTQGWAFAPCNDGYAYTSPAGHYAPNEFGLYDMAGNAWQWTQDCYHDSYKGAPSDGSAWITGDCKNGRVVRGGFWGVFPWYLRAAQRDRVTVRDLRVGFRLARTLISAELSR